MYTFKSVIDQLGDAAQVAGGVVLVYAGGKHICIGRISAETGVFALTREGTEYLEAHPAGGADEISAAVAEVEAELAADEVAEAPKPKGRPKKTAVSNSDLGDADEL